jgi:hypothetical protein
VSDGNELVARDDETGFTCLFLLARAQLDEVGIALEHAIDLGLFGHALDLTFSIFSNEQGCRKAIYQCLRVDWHAVLLERLGYEDLRRIRFAMVGLAEISDIAVYRAEAGNLRGFRPVLTSLKTENNFAFACAYWMCLQQA